MAPVRNIEQLIFRIDRDAMHIRQAGAFTLQTAQRLFISRCSFAVYRNLGWILHADEQFVVLFIDSKSKAAMRSCKNARGLDVSLRVAWKYDNLVARVGLDGINVAILRIDVQTVVKLDVGFGTRN